MSLQHESRELLSPWWRDWRWLAVSLMGLLLLLSLWQVWRVTNHHDLDVFLRAATRLRSADDIYADAAPFKRAIEDGTFSMQDDTVVWPYAYSPLIALFFVPATYMPTAMVQVGWWLLNGAMLLAGSYLCLRAMGQVTPERAALVLLLLYRFSPAVAALRLGQIEIMQFLLLALTLYALRVERDGLAGLALGLATALKFFPGALVALLLWRRRWRPALWALATGALLTILSFWLVGFDAVGRYLQYSTMYGIGGAFAAFPLNQSFNGFFSRNLIANIFTAPLKGWDLPVVAKTLTLLADAVVVGGCAWLTWHVGYWRGESNAATHERFTIEFGLGVVALLLVSPHSQVYSFAWALLPLIVLLAHCRSQCGLAWWGWILLLACYLLLGRDYQLFVPGITRFVQSHFMFGALFLWGLLAWVLWSERRGSTGATRG